MEDIKWVKDSVDLKKINSYYDTVTIKNSGVLETDSYIYANNFCKAGNLITKRLLKKGSIGELDTWYFALVYVYRQSIELMLKANYYKLEKDMTKRKNFIGEARHDVKQCFDEIVRLANIDISKNANLIWLNSFLEDISSIDRSSDMFRYPFGNNLSVVFGEQTYIDLRANFYNFNRSFEMLSEFFNTNKFSCKKYNEEKSYEPKLIIDGGSYYEQSVVGYKYHLYSYYPYFTSYIECGNFLLELVDKYGDRSLFFPMCYMFRNALELGLKRLIVEGSHLETKKALKILSKKKHSILGLWNSIYDELYSYTTNGDGVKDLENAFKYSSIAIEMSPNDERLLNNNRIIKNEMK